MSWIEAIINLLHEIIQTNPPKIMWCFPYKTTSKYMWKVSLRVISYPLRHLASLGFYDNLNPQFLLVHMGPNPNKCIPYLDISPKMVHFREGYEKLWHPYFNSKKDPQGRKNFFLTPLISLLYERNQNNVILVMSLYMGPPLTYFFKFFFF